jgi:hypothetical protein
MDIFKVTSAILSVKWVILALSALFLACHLYFQRAASILCVVCSILSVSTLFCMLPHLFFSCNRYFMRSNFYFQRTISIFSVLISKVYVPNPPSVSVRLSASKSVENQDRFSIFHYGVDVDSASSGHCGQVARYFSPGKYCCHSN